MMMMIMMIIIISFNIKIFASGMNGKSFHRFWLCDHLARLTLSCIDAIEFGTINGWQVQVVHRATLFFD